MYLLLIFHSLQMLGVAEGALNATIPYFNERVQFNRKIGEFQVII